MKEVAAVTWYLAERYQKQQLDQDLAVTSALLHDLGNIVKFKPPFMGELAANANHWQTVQAELKQRYGEDAKEATLNMVQELQVDQRISVVVQGVSDAVLNTTPIPPESLIVEAADLCVTPQGIVGYKARRQDLLDRYAASHGVDWLPQADRFIFQMSQETGVDLTVLQAEQFQMQSDLVERFFHEHELEISL